MNFCNFAKVIIARSSKDPQSVEWWKNKTEGKSSEKTLPAPQLSKFSNLISAPKRYECYQTIMHRYPKMYIPYKRFSSNLSNLQNYLTNNKYWKHANTNGEKQQFLRKFSLESWSLLSEREKNLHSLQDCARCEATNPSSSSLHRSSFCLVGVTVSQKRVSHTEDSNDTGGMQNGSAGASSIYLKPTQSAGISIPVH